MFSALVANWYISSMNSKPKRRWFQFSLRTFFVLVTLICVGFGYWVHWSKEWIRQRHEALASGAVTDWNPPEDEITIAPAGLWLFGERGVKQIVCHKEDKELATRLFPESKLTGTYMPPTSDREPRLRRTQL